MKQTNITFWVEWFFKDKQGHWAIIQLPNILLWVWIVLSVVNIVAHDERVTLFQNATLFAWAYAELTQGSSYFRKSFGALILAVVIIGFFVR